MGYKLHNICVFLFVCKRLETVQPITGKRLGSRHDTAAPPGELLLSVKQQRTLLVMNNSPDISTHGFWFMCY